MQIRPTKPDWIHLRGLGVWHEWCCCLYYVHTPPPNNIRRISLFLSLSFIVRQAKIHVPQLFNENNNGSHVTVLLGKLTDNNLKERYSYHLFSQDIFPEKREFIVPFEMPRNLSTGQSHPPFYWFSCSCLCFFHALSPLHTIAEVIYEIWMWAKSQRRKLSSCLLCSRS